MMISGIILPLVSTFWDNFDCHKFAALEKLTVRDFIRLPVNFVNIVIGKCFPSILVKNHYHQQVVDIYSEFTKYICNSAERYPCLSTHANSEVEEKSTGNSKVYQKLGCLR